jgi:DNA-nicking Smr family endonuclease
MLKLDLQGYKVHETRDVVDSFIHDQILIGGKKVEIITGDSKVIKSVVEDVVDIYGLDCKEHIYNSQVLTIIL